MTTSYIGQPISRIDGRAKVTGEAKYAGEYHVPNLAFGVVVSSAIAKGRITKIDASEALGLRGVLAVLTHENAPNLAQSDRSYKDAVAAPGSPFRPLHSADIKYSGQPVALVVAEEFEIARYAATLVRIDYEREQHETDLRRKRDQAYVPPEIRGDMGAAEPRGDAQHAFDTAAVRHDGEYVHPIEHHNAMELFATTAVWESNGKITIYEKTQGAQNNQRYVVNVFGFSKDDVRVLSPFVGGAYGSGLRPQYQLFLAVLAARELKRSVRVTLTRQQMFTFGYRPETLQRVALGTNADGGLVSIMHDALANTSRFEDYQEPDVNWAGLLYKCDNTKFTYQLAQLDLYTPIDMRAPGGCTGMYALESAMDELAYKLNVDPLELRFKNYSERDQDQNLPFSSKELRQCYRQGADRFGWARRSPQPRSMRDGENLIGWGMATGIWEAMHFKASAKAVLSAGGKLEVCSATADIGTGTYTIMTQIAADRLGLPVENVTFRLGDSFLPQAPVEGGSFTAATVGSAVKAACDVLGKKIFQLAQKIEGSPIAGANPQDVTFADGQMRLRNDPAKAISITAVMQQAKVDRIEEESSVGPSKEANQYARYGHSAIFAEVKVDEDLGTIAVSRVVTAVAGGRILNPKTARSQIIGGVVWGIGMALEEESVIDQKFGRIMNHNLAEYHVPVNADVPDIDVIFVEEHDSIVNPLGVKGLGEIGLVGVAAAIANAVFHATGKRIRELPITLDKLL